MADGTGIHEQKKLLVVVGSLRAEEQLKRMQKKLKALREPISSKNNPSFKNLHRTYSEVVGESSRVRINALKSMADKQHQFYLERKRATHQEFKDSVNLIKKFKEDVGSKKTATYLVQMRRSIHDHRIKLDMEDHRLNEGTLSNQIRIEREIEAKQAEEKRKLRTIKLRDQKMAKQKKRHSITINKSNSKIEKERRVTML